ncbi:MFS transporter [Bacillus sp. UNC41MFS5]|uniref:MFS transporter n=1 Tax=Bacillus sp. UNC41MFS5 TaxID=1449046 RepID=UPI000A6FED5D|nr:MFS transporter [Bacillus sp. UNC41MFS5]
MIKSKWIRIALPFMIGLFIAYLDRSNLSVGIEGMSKELGFSGTDFSVTSSWALSAFLIGYGLANFFGGILTYRMNPKTVVIFVYALWSLATFLTSWVNSVGLLIFFRLILGIGEGIYWPQQSRFAQAWFIKKELTVANTIIQHYGQFLALGLGFLILIPINENWGWKPLFIILGAAGLVIVVPLYLWLLKKEPDVVETKPKEEQSSKEKLTFRSLGGSRFLLLIGAHLGQNMLFWGITLWIPLAVKSLGFTGLIQGLLSGLPYLAAVILTIPMSIISDRTGKRVLIATVGLVFAGILLVSLPVVDSPVGKIALITLSLGTLISTYTANFWAIIQSSVSPSSVGPAIGIVNGIGVGFGGTISSFIVGLLLEQTGSYIPGFTVISFIAIIGGFILYLYGRILSPNNSGMKAEGQVVSLK